MTWAFGTAAGVIVIVTTWIVSWPLAVADVASVTWTVKALAPALPLGVPEMTPVAGASERPAGSAPWVMDQVYGVVPPVAVSVAL